MRNSSNGRTIGFNQAKRRLAEMLQSLPFLSRWAPVGNPLYHRHLGLQWHDMCAESLGMSKVALLFLTRGPVHQETLWKLWLQEIEGQVVIPCAETSNCTFTQADRIKILTACREERSIHRFIAQQQHLFTLYVHPTDPEFPGYRAGSVFHGAEVTNRVPSTAYYSYDLIEATRSMMSSALQDRLNQRFVILSESCVPLYPASFTYMQLMHESKSRVWVSAVPEWHDWQDAVEVKHGINRTTHWRKGSQWNALIRSHAKLAVEDTRLVEAFSSDCKFCQVDERYFATLLALYGVEHESYRPGLLTYVDWSRQTEGGHPHNFEPDDVTPQLLQTMRQKECSKARDSAGAASAKLLLESYVQVAEPVNTTAFPGHPVFQPLSPTCLLFARKFKGPTTDALLDLLQHQSFHEWNYTAAIGTV
ncbi:probable glycosyltransferase BC10 [Coccomyxa sp. Obi]|nr:probable glycosyltransferase BC10 [Coccomyxa sp. Obi]